MDSLLSSYASSDDEETPIAQSSKSSLPPPKSSSSPFSLPPPKSKHQQSDPESSSLFSSIPQLPPPKSKHQQSDPEPSSLFSSIPQPKTAPFLNPLSKSSNFGKKVVQFRPPMNLDLRNSKVDDDDDEEEGEEERERRRRKAESAGEAPSVKSFLSSIPAPRNSVTLGVLGSGFGTGRRNVIDADVQGEKLGSDYQASNLGSENRESEVGVSGSEEENRVGGEIGEVGYVATGEYSSWGAGNENCANLEGYSGGGDGNVEYSSNGNEYGVYGSSGQYRDNWSEGSSGAVPEVPIERALRLPSKRGRRDDPPQFIEVNQDELMKNRPREDQAKMTGIAFGPAYQPASSKGKPTKLHKRKHQIGALYFDMKSKESELAERRSKGFLTKAQTQGKYGW